MPSIRDTTMRENSFRDWTEEEKQAEHERLCVPIYGNSKLHSLACPLLHDIWKTPPRRSVSV